MKHTNKTQSKVIDSRRTPKHQGRLPFKPFDENRQVRIYYNGFLPHWRQAGCTYFVTFRLADSVPESVVEEWKYERDKWLSARGIDCNISGWHLNLRRLTIEDRRTFERNFAGRLFAYLDQGCGDCVLSNGEIQKIVSDSLMFFHGKRLDTGTFVIMPNHVHALLTPYDGFELEDILHSVKSYTANRINRKLVRSGPLWMDETHDHIVRNADELIRIRSYIRANPAKAGLPESQFHLHEAEYDARSKRC